LKLKCFLCVLTHNFGAMELYNSARCGACPTCLQVDLLGLSPFAVAATFGTEDSLVCEIHLKAVPVKLSKSSMQLERLHLIMLHGRSLLYEKHVQELEARAKVVSDEEKARMYGEYLKENTICIICTEHSSVCRCSPDKVQT